MTGTAIAKGMDTHLKNFAALEASGAGFVERLRRTALDRFSELGFPTTRLEDWKYTNLAPVAAQAFGLAPAPTGEGTAQAAATYRLGQDNHLVFLNGRFCAELSQVTSLPTGAIACSLGEALTLHPAAVEQHLARYAGYDSAASTLAALNTAFVHDGAYIYMPRAAVATTPIHLLFVSDTPATPVVTHPRILIVAEESSQVSIVEDYVGLTQNTYWTNAVTEIVAGPNSAVEHCKVQREGDQAFHVATLSAHQAADSRFVSRVFSLGGRVTRNDVHALLDAPGAECTLEGLYLGGGRQHVDHHTCIDHLQPHCTSHELYKGILGGHSTAVFNGKVFVRPDAQKSNAQQMNRNLLLSEDAVVDTKPQLEIFADDVKCSHGATIGRLDEEEIFYLRARGIGLGAARQILVQAFANELTQRVDNDALRAVLEESVLARLGETSGRNP